MTSADSDAGSETAPEGVRFRSLGAGERDAAFELILSAFGADWPSVPISVSPRDHFEWKLESPQAVADQVTVIELDERLIGFWGSINRDAWVDGRREPGRVPKEE